MTAQVYSIETAGLASTPVVKPTATEAYGARLRRYRATFVLAAQSTGAGNELVLAKVPAGLVFAYGVITTDTSLSTSTLAIGNSTTATKYRAAAVFTATDTPTLFGTTAAIKMAALTAEEVVLGTIATAALPASGNLVIDLYFSTPT